MSRSSEARCEAAHITARVAVLVHILEVEKDVVGGRELATRVVHARLVKLERGPPLDRLINVEITPVGLNELLPHNAQVILDVMEEPLRPNAIGVVVIASVVVEEPARSKHDQTIAKRSRVLTLHIASVPLGTRANTILPPIQGVDVPLALRDQAPAVASIPIRTSATHV